MNTFYRVGIVLASIISGLCLTGFFAMLLKSELGILLNPPWMMVAWVIWSVSVYNMVHWVVQEFRGQNDS